jgi:hypothetical protein
MSTPVRHESARRLLARLAPGAVDPLRGPSSTSPGGTTSSDIAGALALIGQHRTDPGGLRVFVPDRLAQALLLYLWAGHDDLAAELVERAAERMASYGKYAWVGRVPESTVHRLVWTALREARDPDPCRECAASGWGRPIRVGVYRCDRDTGEEVYLGTRMQDVTCDTCEGRGAFPWSPHRRAKAYRCDQWTWQKRHASRYEDVRDFLRNREMAGLGRLVHHLRGEHVELSLAKT